MMKDRLERLRGAASRIGGRRAALVLAMLAALAASPAARGQEPSSAQRLEEATRIAARLLLDQQDPVAAAVRAAAEARAALAAVATRVDPGEEIGGEHDAALERYAETVAALGLQPDPRTVAALAAAVAHRDERVRLAAVTALREGAAADPREPVWDDVRSRVIADPSPEVRRQAFEAYCRWADPDAVLALSMSLGRAASPVQDLAVREWIRIEQERAEEAAAPQQMAADEPR